MSEAVPRETSPAVPGPGGLMYRLRSIPTLLLAIVIAGGAALLYIQFLMQPAEADLWALVQFMAISGGVSVVLGWVAFQLGAGRLLPNLGLKIALMYIAGVAVVFVNILVTSILMFLSPHDFGLLTTLLLFAA